MIQHMIAQLVKNLLAKQETLVRFLGLKIPWRRDRLRTPVFWPGEFHELYSPSGCKELDMTEWLNWTELNHLVCGQTGKESACNVGDLSSIPGLGRSPGERKGYPLQYSGLENSMDCIVHRVAKSWTWLSGFQFHHLLGACPLLSGVGYLFLVGSNILLLMVVQQRASILKFLLEKMTTRPSTPPSWILWNPQGISEARSWSSSVPCAAGRAIHGSRFHPGVKNIINLISILTIW